jgi:hypothetical protein
VSTDSNTYIALHSTDASIGTGHYKYGEYQYVCSTEQIAAKKCFGDIDMYQLFDLTADPFELKNIYNQTVRDLHLLTSVSWPLVCHLSRSLCGHLFVTV